MNMRKLHVLSCGISLLIFTCLMAAETYGQSVAELTQKLELLKAYPELIVVNGKIATMDDRMTQVQAMAVKNNRILALGTNDEIRFLAGPKTQVLDAKGRRVIPGLIDSHTHPPMWVWNHRLGAEGDITVKRYNTPELKEVLVTGMEQTDFVKGIERAVTQRAKELGPGKWILIRLFSGNSVPEARKAVFPLFGLGPKSSAAINRQLLDALAPNNPLAVFSSEAIGPTLNNTKAKEAMEKLVGEEIDGVSETSVLLWDILLRGKLDVAVDLMRRELQECLVEQGFTTFADHYVGVPSVMKVYNELYQRGELPIRHSQYIGSVWSDQFKNDSKVMSFFMSNLGDWRGIGNDYLWNAGVAHGAWQDAITTCTFAEPPKAKGIPTSSGPWTPGISTYQLCPEKPDWEKSGGYQGVRYGLENGLRMTFMHGYSDGGFDAIFHLFEQLQAEGKITLQQIRELRMSMEHDPVIRPDQVEKMGYYRMYPAVQGYQIQGDIKGGEFLKVYGEKYMTWILPIKSLITAGARPVISTDLHLNSHIPIQWKDMDFPSQWEGNIWAFIQFFMNRKMPSDGITYNAKEGIDRATALKSLTIWAAERELNEKNIGSLEVGKLADFDVLDKDYFSIPEDQIWTIKTLLTSVGGKISFKSPIY